MWGYCHHHPKTVKCLISRHAHCSITLVGLASRAATVQLPESCPDCDFKFIQSGGTSTCQQNCPILWSPSQSNGEDGWMARPRLASWKKKLKLEQIWSRSANLGIETALDLALDACKQGWSPAHRWHGRCVWTGCTVDHFSMTTVNWLLDWPELSTSSIY